jgi:hypothetical protein
MTVYLQPVELPPVCFLHEVLLWVAFERLPIALYNEKGHELRDATDIGEYAIEIADTVLDEHECRRAGIPVDPEYIARLNHTSTGEPEFYRELLRKYSHDDAQVEELNQRAELAAKFVAECTSWKPNYLRAIEYPASQIFVALRGQHLNATGRLLPDLDKDRAIAILEEEDRDFYDIPRTKIPASFWTLKGIDFEASAACNETAHYCHISLSTAEVISRFPGEREVVSVERVGDSFVLVDSPKPAPSLRNRGRPSYPWDRFHLEVAAQLQRSELPSKKEAAIKYFQAWFKKELRVHPSRAVIGERLTPYYDRFVRRGGQKS